MRTFVNWNYIITENDQFYRVGRHKKVLDIACSPSGHFRGFHIHFQTQNYGWAGVRFFGVITDLDGENLHARYLQVAAEQCTWLIQKIILWNWAFGGVKRLLLFRLRSRECMEIFSVSTAAQLHINWSQNSNQQGAPKILIISCALTHQIRKLLASTSLLINDHTNIKVKKDTCCTRCTHKAS